MSWLLGIVSRWDLYFVFDLEEAGQYVSGVVVKSDIVAKVEEEVLQYKQEVCANDCSQVRQKMQREVVLISSVKWTNFEGVSVLLRQWQQESCKLYLIYFTHVFCPPYFNGATCQMDPPTRNPFRSWQNDSMSPPLDQIRFCSTYLIRSRGNRAWCSFIELLVSRGSG